MLLFVEASMKISCRTGISAKLIIIHICILLLTTRCTSERINLPNSSKETPSPAIKTVQASQEPAFLVSATQAHEPKTRKPAGFIPSGHPSTPTDVSNTQLPDPNMFSSVPHGTYLVYLFQQEIHAISLDGSNNMVVGKEGDISFIEYGKIAFYDKKCNCTIYYDLVDGKLVEYGRVAKAEASDCRYETAPNLQLRGSICQDSSQLMIASTQTEWLRVVDKSGIGPGEPFSIMDIAWSPDSTWLASFRFRGSSPLPADADLVFFNAEVTNDGHNLSIEKFGPYQNTNQAFNGQGPSVWSADGKYLAFPSTSGSAINIFDIEEKTFTTIDLEEAYYVKELEWLPDSETFVFSDDFRLYIASIQGGKPDLLLENKLAVENEISLLGWISNNP